MESNENVQAQAITFKTSLVRRSSGEKLPIQTGVHEKGSFLLTDLVKDIKNKPELQRAGAIALFIGVVRGETPNGEKVQKLELEAYEEKANKTLTKICEDLKKKEGIVDAQIHHLLGEFTVNEDLVYVSVAGAHRKHVFPALQEAVDRYKREAPIFKKEYVIDEKGEAKAYWAADHAK